MRPLMPLLVAAALLPGLGPAHAAGEGAVLKNTVAAKFNGEDLKRMRSAVQRVLRSDKDGDTLEWKNDKSGAAGSATALNGLSWNGMDCRRVRIVNTHGRTTAQGVYKFCETPAGRWKLVGPEPS